MKNLRRIAPVFMLLLLLSGCGKEDSCLDEAMSFRQRLLSASGCTFSTEITADYGDRLYTFSTDCQGGKDGTLNFTVTAPETIAGISGTLEPEGGKLTFDDTAVDFGLLADSQISPVSCTYFMLTAWRTGYISAAGNTEDGLQITFDLSFQEEPLTADLWLNQEGIPTYGEIAYRGRRILSASFENFVFLSDGETS